jgi:sugar phosphate isomerase/epimerase
MRRAGRGWHPHSGLRCHVPPRTLYRAASYDVVLGLETRAIIPSASDSLEIIDRVDSDHLGVTLETGNLLAASDADPTLPFLEAIEALAPHIVATHMWDVTYDRGARAWRCVPCGEGVVNFKAIAEILKDVDYPGTLALEYIDNNQHHAKDDLDAIKPVLRNCVEYLRYL